MATRRLLSYAFQERPLFRKAQNALHGIGPAQCAEPINSRRFAPWFLHSRDVVMPEWSHARPQVIHGDRWREELKNLNNAARDRLHQEVVSPWERKKPADQRKRLLRIVQMDSLIKRLRQIPHACISHQELLQICIDSAGDDDAKEVVKSLHESGKILIVGDLVYLRPEQVARVIDSVVLPLLDECRSEELQDMEKQKAEIDLDAKKIVRRELWCGFGFLSVQTAAFMRLTFWELSWDVMEPICFYMTSIYFLASYAFFLITSTEPTFEGLFHARFKSRQKRLMKKRNFDIERFNELRVIAGPPLKQPARGTSYMRFRPTPFHF